MKEDNFHKLVSKASREEPPRIDVARQVMAILHDRDMVDLPRFTPLAWIAALSTAMAIVVALIAMGSWESATDPLLKIFIELPWSTL